MIIVGLTGGIGSGKSTVANAFNALGIPVYIADEEAKRLMNKSQVIKRQLIGLFGEEVYTKEGLNRSFIANIIFKNKSLLNKINDIVHPEVAKHFKKWVKAQNGPYVVKEAAILFENNGYKACDYVITVTAPKDVKMQRLLSRDKTSIERIEAIMQNQWHDEDRIPLSDFVIENTDLENTKKQVLNIHHKILERIR
ncbi:dephospho-CoA kinase [Aestuariivivens sediminicola]|uniref:dephospho-CoA kinase n=1 Tax=Aestuariivivens sediminicola TaxID=2913560 RepID=UPI001F5AFE80|nr:dephospho-CoA kinase [Aestuariivivens sediminicola]